MAENKTPTKLVIEFDYAFAILHGIVVCKCGCRIHNHEDNPDGTKGGCSLCRCDRYDEVAIRGGTIIERK